MSDTSSHVCQTLRQSDYKFEFNGKEEENKKKTQSQRIFEGSSLRNGCCDLQTCKGGHLLLQPFQWTLNTYVTCWVSRSKEFCSVQINLILTCGHTYNYGQDKSYVIVMVTNANVESHGKSFHHNSIMGWHKMQTIANQMWVTLFNYFVPYGLLKYCTMLVII